MIKLEKVSLEQLELLQQSYHTNMVAPLDDYWTYGVIAKGDCYGIYEKTLIGYLIIQDHILLQFHLEAYEEQRASILSLCINELKLTSAYASTYEPEYFNRCLDQSVSYTVEGYFYTDYKKVCVDKPLQEMVEKEATLAELESAIIYTQNSMNAPRDWLESYYSMLIEMNGLYLYYYQDDIIGTGEIRIRKDVMNIANIGMTVAPELRKKGIGLYILNEMKLKSYQRNARPVCGTDKDNIASQKTIEKCGFYPYHRVVEFKIK